MKPNPGSADNSDGICISHTEREGERQGKPQLQEPRNPLPTECGGSGDNSTATSAPPAQESARSRDSHRHSGNMGACEG